MIAGGDIREIQGKYCSALSGAERLDCKKLVKDKPNEAEGVVNEMSSSTPSEIGKALLDVLKGNAAGGPDVPLGQGAPAPVPAPAPGAGTPPAPAAGGGTAGVPPDVYGSILNQINANPSILILNPFALVDLEKLRSACEEVQEKDKCKAAFTGAVSQLYLQTNGDLRTIVEALNNYNAPRTFVNLQNGKGEVVPVNSLAELENLLKTGFGQTGGGDSSIAPSGIVLGADYPIGLGPIGIGTDNPSDVETRDTFGGPAVRGYAGYRFANGVQLTVSAAIWRGYAQGDSVQSENEDTGELESVEGQAQYSHSLSPDLFLFGKLAVGGYWTTDPVLQDGLTPDGVGGIGRLDSDMIGITPGIGIEYFLGRHFAFHAGLDFPITWEEHDTTIDPSSPSVTYTHLGYQGGWFPPVILNAGVRGIINFWSGADDKDQGR